MTTSNSLLPLDRSSDYYRQSRRRWVPKGVMLLIVLFAVGLLGACQGTAHDNAVAEIVVPGMHSVAVSCHQRNPTGDSVYLVASLREAQWTGRAERSNLQTF